jgi:hypothetical protein
MSMVVRTKPRPKMVRYISSGSRAVTGGVVVVICLPLCMCPAAAV